LRGSLELKTALSFSSINSASPSNSIEDTEEIAKKNKIKIEIIKKYFFELIK